MHYAEGDDVTQCCIIYTRAALVRNIITWVELQAIPGVSLMSYNS